MSDGDEQTTTAKLGSTLGAFLAVPMLLLLAIAAVYAVGDAILAEAPSPRNPGLADGILASRAVIAAIRVAIIAAAGYVVVSVVALVSRRQWLARIGPVKRRKAPGKAGGSRRYDEFHRSSQKGTAGLVNEELRQQILRMVEENEREIRRSREQSLRTQQFLRESERRTERARRKLRQAGVLK